MTSMTHRERVLKAISFQEPDRVPMDLGSHVDSSIHVVAYEKLAQHLGIEVQWPPKIASKMMQDVEVDDALLTALDIDLRGVFPGALDKSGPDETQDGVWVDEWGVRRVKPEGAHYYDIISPAPLAGDISISDIVNYPWPDPDDPGLTRGLKEQVRHWRETTDCALVLRVPGPFVHQSQYMRGFEDWFMDVAANPTLIGALFDAILEIRMAQATCILDEVGQEVDIVMTGDDMGTQQGLQFSPRAYRQLFKPRQARFFDLVHSKTPAKVLLHSCGSLYPIINDLIEIGVEILNPVQTRARDMEPEKLKREFGNRLVFWGGVDIQEVMPFGSPDDVRAEVKRLFETLGDGGGWVLSPSHNLQPEVPPENIVTLYRDGAHIARYR